MDPEIALLAGTAGTTIATLLSTDAWNGARAGLLSLWQRIRPGQEEDIAAQLDGSRRELLTALTRGDEETGREIAVEWQGRIRRLLVAHPEAAAELRSVLAEFAPDAAGAPPTVTQRATASGRSRVYQAGRDLNIDQR